MKRLIKELGTIGLAVIFLLSFLQPFGIDQMGGLRMLLIIGESLLAVLTSAISLLVVEKLFHQNWHETKGLLLYHLVNIPLLSAGTLSLISWFTWDSLTKAWYCTAGQFSIINYLKVCVEVSLISFFIFILQIYRHRNSRLQQELDEVRAINQLLEKQQAEDSEASSSRVIEHSWSIFILLPLFPVVPLQVVVFRCSRWKRPYPCHGHTQRIFMKDCSRHSMVGLRLFE